MLYKNSLQGTWKNATSIFIIYEVDTIEKLTSWDTKVYNSFFHQFWSDCWTAKISLETALAEAAPCLPCLLKASCHSPTQ